MLIKKKKWSKQINAKNTNNYGNSIPHPSYCKLLAIGEENLTTPSNLDALPIGSETWKLNGLTPFRAHAPNQLF